MKARLPSLLVVSAVVAAAALASATFVRADGMDRGPAAYVPGLSWSGIYIGTQSGWMDSDISGHFTSAPSTGLHFKAEPNGGIVGFHLGYQYQWSNLVLGVEGGLSQDYSSGDQGRKIGGGGSGACGLGTGDACNGRIYQIREIGGKLGWAMGRWMAYGTGGFADARINTWETLSGTHSNEGSNDHNGWFAGGGLDYALSKNAIIGIQYKHYDFGSESHIDVAGTDNRVVRAESDAIMSRMTLKFGLERGYEPLK